MILNPKVIFRVVLSFLISFLRPDCFCCMLGTGRWQFKYSFGILVCKRIGCSSAHSSVGNSLMETLEKTAIGVKLVVF